MGGILGNIHSQFHGYEKNQGVNCPRFIFLKLPIIADIWNFLWVFFTYRLNHFIYDTFSIAPLFYRRNTVNFINSSSPSRTTCILAVCLLTNSSIWWFASGNKSLPCHRWRCLLWLLIYSCYSLLLSYYTVGHIFKFLGQVCSFQPPF